MKTELSRELYGFLIDYIMMDEGVKQVLDIHRVAESMDAFVSDLKIAIVDIEDWCDDKKLPSPTCLFRAKPTCFDDVVLGDVFTNISGFFPKVNLRRSGFSTVVKMVRDKVIVIEPLPESGYVGYSEFYFEFDFVVKNKIFEHDMIEKYFFNS